MPEVGAARKLTIGVLVCTYRRTRDLQRCLSSLQRQTLTPDDVIVVSQSGDEETSHFLAALLATDLPLRSIKVDRTGVVAARNAGLMAGRTDILCQIDDDTAPHEDWCCRILAHFERNDRLGALGGRDRVHDGIAFDDELAEPVGLLRWYGRTIGNHHRGFGASREVMILKGANMSFRASATAGLLFDDRLRGSGAEPHEDVAFSLAVRRRGWQIVYDPAVLVDHYAARSEKRAYSSVDADVDWQQCFDSAHNKTLALWDEMSPVRRIVFVLWSSLIGTGAEPGVLQMLRYLPRGGAASLKRFAATQRGKFAAVVFLHKHQAARFSSVGALRTVDHASST